MAARFTIGIEEEFQIVDRKTGQLSPHILTIMEKGAPLFGEQIKPEMLQPAVELISAVYPNIAAARLETQHLRAKLAELMEGEGHALVSAGTHPAAHWLDQLVTPNPRYFELLEEFQDVALSILIFGLHVHIAVDGLEMAVTLISYLKT